VGSVNVAFVADEDSRSLHTIDVDHREQLSRTPLDGAPAQVLVLADGRVAVSLKDRNEIQILEGTADAREPLTSLCTQEVPSEPLGLAATTDDKQLLVTSGWGKSLTALDGETMKPAFAVDLPRDPRAVLVDDTGQRAFVSHAVGSKLSVVDLASSKHEVRSVDMSVTRSTPTGGGATEKPRGGAQGYALARSVVVSGGPSTGGSTGGSIGEAPPIAGHAPPALPPPRIPKGRIFVPMVTVEPGDPNVRSNAYYGESRDGVPKEAPIVSVIDEGAERPLTRSVMSLGTTMTRECLLPRAAAARGQTGTLLVTCLGIDAMLELDTRGSDPARLEKRRWILPAGPTGVAVDEDASRAVVWSQFEGRVSVIDLSGDRPHTPESMAVESDIAPSVMQLALGRQLYNLTDDTRISNDGVACASCHPEGRDDAFTWSTPEGPRQTIMLAGRVPNTEPYGWQGKHGNLRQYLGNTFSRLGGSGLSGAELEALMAYIQHLPGPPDDPTTRGFENASVSEGKQLFFDADLACASCHVEGGGVDKVVHDVGSKAVADLAPKFDTPSLKFVRGTAPYFHDGRYKTLDDLLNARDSEMGHTLQLTSHQRSALTAYLESL
jgi:DNA-binding beta-propeller fold protein YncE